jgi:hypothetical protein
MLSPIGRGYEVHSDLLWGKKNSVASVRKRTIPTERPPLFSKVSANFFADRGCHVVSVTNPYGRILGSLSGVACMIFSREVDQRRAQGRNLLYQQQLRGLSPRVNCTDLVILLICTHESEWIPFQTHYFSENLVAPGIDHRPAHI